MSSTEPRSSVDTDRQRTIEARVERLRQRIARAEARGNTDRELSAALKGILDLLEDWL